MIFTFKNLGTIKEAEIEVGNLTIIAGKNNTGKTYLTYAVWGILAREIRGTVIVNPIYPFFDMPTIIEKLRKEKVTTFLDNGAFHSRINERIDAITKNISAKLHTFFNTPEEYFQKTKIEFVTKVKKQSKYKAQFFLKDNSILNFSSLFSAKEITVTLEIENYSDKLTDYDIEGGIKVALHHMMYHFILPTRPFLLTAQRDSIQLFYRELDKHRSDLIDKLREQESEISLKQLLEKETARFAMPIKANIDFARDITTQVIKTDSFLAAEQPELLAEIENMLGVNYMVANDGVFVKDKETGTVVPDFMASTSVRALMHLHFWLKHKATKGAMLMIDEPELNLHPENQVKMARLFAKLVNVGIKVWITTHSDYIIKELNNCLMLSQNIENKKELMQELGYQENEILKADDVKVYITRPYTKQKGYTVQVVQPDEYGVEMNTFDDISIDITENANQIAVAIDEYKIKNSHASAH